MILQVVPRFTCHALDPTFGSNDFIHWDFPPGPFFCNPSITHLECQLSSYSWRIWLRKWEHQNGSRPQPECETGHGFIFQIMKKHHQRKWYDLDSEIYPKQTKQACLDYEFVQTPLTCFNRYFLSSKTTTWKSQHLFVSCEANISRFLWFSFP